MIITHEVQSGSWLFKWPWNQGAELGVDESTYMITVGFFICVIYKRMEFQSLRRTLDIF